MSLRNTVHLTTLDRSDPASARIALMFSQHAAVCTAMLPLTSWPDGSPGIWPETKMRPVLGAAMAWVCGVRREGGKVVSWFFFGVKGGKGWSWVRGFLGKGDLHMVLLLGMHL